MFVTFLYFILILGVIVLVHEFGHFIFAKMFGVHVYEFSIGMGPKIWGTKPKKKGKTPLNIRAFPIGGYVSLAGEEVDSDDDKKIPVKDRLYSKPKWQRFLIMFFGAGNNFILALLILFSLGLFKGSPIMDPVVRELDESYPMYQAGIRVNDRFVSINNQKVDTSDDVQVYLALAQKDAEATFVMERNGEKTTYKITPVKEKENDETIYRFGIVFENKYEKGCIPAIKYTFTKTGALLKQMCIVIKSLFTGRLGLNNLSGPVGIYGIVGEAKAYGFSNILYLIAVLSINVGFINLIPLPAFDGGRILFLIIEAIKGSPVSPKTEGMIHTVGFILLIILMIIITLNDIIKLF